MNIKHASIGKRQASSHRNDDKGSACLYASLYKCKADSKSKSKADNLHPYHTYSSFTPEQSPYSHRPSDYHLPA